VGVLRRVPRGAFLLGVYGLLAFHACYFFALQSAPALEASLIIYLWPLLIVVFSGLLPASAGGRRLTWPHYLGALLGFAGAAQILIGASQDLSLAGAPTGYGLALAAALIWSSYSVASRLYARVPSAAVTAACAATAVGAALLHLALETTVWPATPTEWLAVLGLGLGPTGLAFYIWDEGMKRGDMRLLGVASYATPLLSTLVLWLSGLAAPGGSIWIAAALITAGAFIAGRSAT
jgi:drug/metabolite transporter (DMT)-like permease